MVERLCHLGDIPGYRMLRRYSGGVQCESTGSQRICLLERQLERSVFISVNIGEAGGKMHSMHTAGREVIL